VVLTSEYHPGSENRMSYTVYVVSVAGERVSTRIDGFREDCPRARARGERVAKFLRLPIHDEKEEGEVVIRQVAELDESLAQRARRTGERLEAPPQPDDGVAEHAVRNGDAVFRIPPGGFGIGEAVLLVFGGVGLVPVLAALVLFIIQPDAAP
jgi:hypothetical protein